MSKPKKIRKIDTDADVTATNGQQEMPSSSSSSPPPPPQPPYTKMIDDCWEYIFDYLSFKDIIVMGHTCKRLNQMAGYYIREYHPQLQFQLTGREVQFPTPHSFEFHLHTDFYQYVSKLYLWENNQLDFFRGKNKLDSLKILIFENCHLTEGQIIYMKTILKHLETIHLINCNIGENIFTHLSNYCSELKYLNVSSCKFDDINIFNTLFLSRFPKLERLQFRPMLKNSFEQIDGIKTFFKNHSKTLKCFETNLDFLWTHRYSIDETTIQLDLLSIHFDKWYVNTPIDKVVEYLTTLQLRDFFKSLQLSFRRGINIDTQTVTNAISILPTLESLSLNSDSFVDIKRLTNLKELHIENLCSRENMEIMAKSLPKLERLTFNCCLVDSVMAFVRHSMNLKTIRIGDLRDFRTLDLIAMNQERKKLANACRISIFVCDQVYVHEKSKRPNLNLSHVKMVRLDMNRFFLISNSHKLIWD